MIQVFLAKAVAFAPKFVLLKLPVIFMFTLDFLHIWEETVSNFNAMNGEYLNHKLSKLAYPMLRLNIP